MLGYRTSHAAALVGFDGFVEITPVIDAAGLAFEVSQEMQQFALGHRCGSSSLNGDNGESVSPRNRATSSRNIFNRVRAVMMKPAHVSCRSSLRYRWSSP